MFEKSAEIEATKELVATDREGRCAAVTYAGDAAPPTNQRAARRQKGWSPGAYRKQMTRQSENRIGRGCAAGRFDICKWRANALITSVTQTRLPAGGDNRQFPRDTSGHKSGT